MSAGGGNVGAGCGRCEPLRSRNAKPPRRPITLTGHIEAEDEVGPGFRIAGRVLANDGKLEDRVMLGRVLARLESQSELKTLGTAQADLAAAQGQLTQRNHFERQDTLFKQGVYWAEVQYLLLSRLR